LSFDRKPTKDGMEELNSFCARLRYCILDKNTMVDGRVDDRTLSDRSRYDMQERKPMEEGIDKDK